MHRKSAVNLTGTRQISYGVHMSVHGYKLTHHRYQDYNFVFAQEKKPCHGVIQYIKLCLSRYIVLKYSSKSSVNTHKRYL